MHLWVLQVLTGGPMSRRKEGTRWQDLPEGTHEFDTPHRGPRRHGRTYAERLRRNRRGYLEGLRRRFAHYFNEAEVDL